MLALVLHPEAQRQAQEQIDIVVGRERLPVLSDREHLPYVEAVVKESLRWRPVAPLAIPRRSTKVCPLCIAWKCYVQLDGSSGRLVRRTFHP